MVQTTRRSTRGAPAKGAQSKIAFGTQVTKRTASISKDSKAAESAKSKLSQIEPADTSKKPAVVALEDDTNDAKGTIGAKGDTEKLSAAEREAQAVKPEQIKAYWGSCENERIAPRGEISPSPSHPHGMLSQLTPQYSSPRRRNHGGENTPSLRYVKVRPMHRNHPSRSLAPR